LFAGPVGQQMISHPFKSRAPNTYIFIDMCTDLPLKKHGFIAEFSTLGPVWLA
jgi:hypothetical protein